MVAHSHKELGSAKRKENWEINNWNCERSSETVPGCLGREAYTGDRKDHYAKGTGQCDSSE